MPTYEDPKLGRWAYDIPAWATVGGVSRPVAIYLVSLDEPPRAVNRYVLRAVELHEAAHRSRGMLELAKREEGTPLGDKFGRVAAMQAGPTKGGRPPVSDETLRTVARLWRASDDPYKTLKDELGGSEATHRKHIGMARRRTDPLTGEPFLDPALRKRRPRKKEG